MTKQANIDDYHSWNIKKNGAIIDNLDMDFLKYVALKQLGTINFDIVYKEWKTYPSYYDMKIKEHILQFNTLSKQEQLSYLKQNISHICDKYSALRKMLFKYDIIFGSLGVKDRNTGKIFWEFGNGENVSDFL